MIGAAFTGIRPPDVGYSMCFVTVNKFVPFRKAPAARSPSTKICVAAQGGQRRGLCRRMAERTQSKEEVRTPPAF
jgi:hypothetical protein